MEEDMIITLEDNEKYLLLLQNASTEGKYFLAVLLDENEKPVHEYVVLEEIDCGESAELVTDPKILTKLLDDYQRQYDKMCENEDE